MVADGWKVKYDGMCSRCGIALRTGEVAVYDRQTRSIHCVVCPSVAAVADPPPIDTGVAGASARREYERRKTAREDRIRSRFGGRLGGVVLALTDDPHSTRAWATGARGEEKLAEALKSIDGLRALHDRRVPAPAGTSTTSSSRRPASSSSTPSATRGGSRSATAATSSGPTTGCTWTTRLLGARGRADLAGRGRHGRAGRRRRRAVAADHAGALFHRRRVADDLAARVLPRRRLEGPKSIRKVATATPVLDADEADALVRILSVALAAKHP